MYDGSIRINTRLDSKGFKTGIQTMMGSLGQLAATMGVVFGVAGIVAFGKASVKAAADSESAWAGLKFVMDANQRSFDQGKAYLQEYTQDGLVPLTNAVAAYQNMVMRGYETDQIEKMLLVMKDAAAYGRQGQFSMGEAIEKATQGLRMENSLLTDSAGIQKNVAVMWRDYAVSIGTTANNLTLAQKRQAEFNGFMAEGGIYAGAASQYLNSYAGRMAQLSASMLNLKVAVGNAIIPAINAVLPYILNLINWLTVLFNTFGRVMNLLFGTNVGASDMEKQATATQGAADAQGKLAENTEKAGKAAKGSLASFDKLNVLASTESGGGSPIIPDGSQGGTVPPPDTSDAEGVFDALATKIEMIKQKFLEFFAPMKEPLKRLGEAWKNLKDAIVNALTPLFEDKNGSRKKFLEDIRDGAIILIDKLTMALNGLASWIEENPEIFQALIVAIGGILLALALVGSSVLAVVFLIGVLGTAIALGAKHWEEYKNVLAPLLIILGAFILLTLGVPAAILAIGLAVAAIAVTIIKNLDTIKEKFQEVADKIASLFNGMGDWFRRSVTEPIAYWFSISAENIAKFLNNTWDSIVSKWQGAKEWFATNVINPITGAFDTAWKAIGGFAAAAFESPKQAIKNALNGLIGLMNDVLSGLGSGINRMISALNSINVDIPSWVPFIGGNTFGVNLGYVDIPQIPYLATGAVIPPNAPFAAILGDNKTQSEILAPEGTIRDIIREELAGLRTEAQNMTIQFGGAIGRFVQELDPYFEQEKFRRGSSLAINRRVR